MCDLYCTYCTAATFVNITSDFLVYREGRYFTQVGRYIDMQLSAPAGTEIAPGSVINWLVQVPREMDRQSYGGEDRSLVYNFPSWGEYTILVQGSYFTTGSLAGIINIFALSK